MKIDEALYRNRGWMLMLCKWDTIVIPQTLISFKAARRMAWLRLRWRTWQAAISLGELHASFDPKISECETYCLKKTMLFESVHAGNWNILVPAGKENNSDSLSNSEWKGKRANWIFFREEKEMWCRMSCASRFSFLVSQSFLEWNTLESDSLIG